MSEAIPIAIVGAGGAGLIAAWRAASLGAPVLLLERNRRPGIKLLISGGGKCNVTHDGAVEEILAAFLPHERRFLKPSVHRFSNSDLIRLLDRSGVATAARPNGRFFPVSGRADDVVDAFVAGVRKLGVDLRTEIPVESVECTPEGAWRLSGEGSSFEACRLVLATGGVSYPKTGTTGDGFRWAAALGHTIVPLQPALAPIGVEPPLPAEWRGVALRGGRLSVKKESGVLASWAGDLLFTHEGISGPAALELSRVAARHINEGGITLCFDFFPTKEFNAVDEELNRLIRRNLSRTITSIVALLVPDRIAQTLVSRAGVNPEQRGHVLTREERRTLTHVLKEWTLGGVGRVDIARGEVTAGGVALDEVDPKTMKSRKVPGLYLCGELLDIAGPIGGYNLQAAFSTGFTAGESAAREFSVAGGCYRKVP